MNADLVVLSGSQILRDVSLGGYICLQPGIMGLYIGKGLDGTPLISAHSAEAREVWTPGGFTLNFPSLYVYIQSGQFALLMPAQYS